MKKTILLLAMVTMSFCSSFAQDTLHIRDMRLMTNYYVPMWPDSFRAVYVYGDKYEKGYVEFSCSHAKENAYKMVTDDTLQVYGIAASLSTLWRVYPDYVESLCLPPGQTFDTSCEFLYRYLRLYEADPDSLRHIGDELLVHMWHTPSYYIDLELYRGMDDGNIVFWPILPMYERYFSSPVTVADSFYVGFRNENFNSYRPVVMAALGDTLYRRQNTAAYHDDTTVASWGEVFISHGWFYGGESTQQVPFLFPILAPPDTTSDTIVNPNDTTGVGIGERELLQRYVAVSPNPATSSATVTSSFGLSQVDLYDPQGRLLKTFPAASKASSSSTSPATLSLTLDLSALPRGTYLLRILTPLGPTTKKLLLQ